MALSAEAAARIRRRIAYLREHAAHLVIDGDVHPSDHSALPPAVRERLENDPNYYHGRPLLSQNLVAKMNQAGVDVALCWQNPAVLPYGDDPDDNAARLTASNERIAKLAQEHPQRVIPAGWTDPKALGTGNAITLARRCVEDFAMPVVKMNPAQNQYPIDDPMVVAVVDAIVELGAVPAFHFGADTPYTPATGLERVAQRHPAHPVIGVHMGGGGGHFVEAEPNYQAAREIGLRNPNIFYVLSAKRDPHIESALITYAAAGPPFDRNLAAGSDAPYGDMVWHFGAFRALFAALGNGRDYGDPRLAANPSLFDATTVARFMGGNLVELVLSADQRILAVSRR
jgi:predicted TIM-barrel fold metal-dependent hydrolase